MVQQVHCSRRRLLRRRLEFHVCTINKVPIQKKSGNLLNDLVSAKERYETQRIDEDMVQILAEDFSSCGTVNKWAAEFK